MSITIIFIFGVVVTIIGLGATLILVLSESADPESANERTLNAFERFFVGKWRKKKKQSMDAHDKRIKK